MTDLSWYEMFPGRGLTVDSVTAFVRPLASRPRVGFRRRTPMVIFEQWSTAGQTRYLLAVEQPLDTAFVDHLVATMPGLSVRAIDQPPRKPLRYGCTVTLTSIAASLRTDTALDVAVAQNAALAQAADHRLVVQWIVGPGQARAHRPTPFQPLVQLGFAAPSPVTSQDQTQWRQKASEPLFAVRGRIGTSGPLATVRALRSAIQLADSAAGHLIVGPPSPRTASQLSDLRRPSWGGIVSARELATLLAWPLDGGHYRTPLPIGDLPPAPTEGGRPLGISLHPASVGQVATMPAGALSRQQLVIGPTGSGKSFLLTHAALADIAAGRSLVFIEPKGDTIDAIMERLDPAVFDRVVLIEAGQVARPVGSNPLGGHTDDAERQADEIVGYFRGLHGTALGPRSTDVLLHAVLLAAKTGGTLPDVPMLLTNTAFRGRMAATLTDPMVLEPWLAGFENLSDAERAQVTAPILNKLRGLTARASLRRLLGQQSPGWTWDDMLGGGGIVLVSLNRGVIGPEAAALLGTLLLGQLWGAIQRRTRIPGAQRRLAAVIVDEWQLFTGGLDFADVLATARGMSTSITLANQSLSQLSPSLRAAVGANTRSKLTFLPAKDDAGILAGLLGSVNVTAEDLLRLGQYEAVASVYGVDGAFHVKTEPLPPKRQDAAVVREASRARYGQSGDAVDAALLARWNQAPDHGVGRIRRGDPR